MYFSLLPTLYIRTIPMTERDTEIWEAITSNLNRTSTKEQDLLINKWLDESDENRKTFEILTKVKKIKIQPSEADKEDVYKRIHSGIRKGRNERRIRLLKYGNVASILLILSLCIALFWPKQSFHSINIETRCPLGTKSKVTLSDGTIVHLNSGTVIEYPAIFSDGLREVKLRGEAFFEVTHDKSREFIVNTGEIAIKVFGTRFNVKNYETDKEIETTLVDGTVGIFRKDYIGHQQALIMKPNEQVVYEKQTKELISRSLDAELVSIWKEGKFYFEDETFEEIAQKLEREFNIQIVIESKELSKAIFTGMFDKNRTIYQMLDLMKRKRDFFYKIVNDTIIITKN